MQSENSKKSTTNTHANDWMSSPLLTTWMGRAFELARRGLYTTTPNPRVGALIIQDDVVIGEGFHQRAGQPHAEIMALHDAVAKGHQHNILGATMVVSLEPCCHHGRTPPCVEAIIAAGIKTVIVAVQDPNPKVAGQGMARLMAHGITVINLADINAPHIKAAKLVEEAIDINVGFFQRHQRHRPWVRLKMAVSLDGRTRDAQGRSQWITGDAARADVQKWRAQSCAILTGIGTILADNPRLSVRLSEADYGAAVIRQPIKVVVDSHHRLGATMTINGGRDKPWALLDGAQVLHYVVDSPVQRNKKDSAQEMINWQTIHMPATQNHRVNLNGVFADLSRRGVLEVWVEAGATLAGALLEANLVDECVLYYAPRFLGQHGGPLAIFEKNPTLDITTINNFFVVNTTQIGEDIRVILRRTL